MAREGDQEEEGRLNLPNLNLLIKSMLWVVQAMKDVLRRQPRHDAYNKEQQIWMHFLEALKFSLPFLDDEHILAEAVELFVGIAEMFPVREPTSAEEEHELATRWECCEVLVESQWDWLTKSQSLGPFLHLLPMVSRLVLQGLPQHREQCLRRLRVYNHPSIDVPKAFDILID